MGWEMRGESFPHVQCWGGSPWVCIAAGSWHPQAVPQGRASGFRGCGCGRCGVGERSSLPQRWHTPSVAIASGGLPTHAPSFALVIDGARGGGGEEGGALLRPPLSEQPEPSLPPRRAVGQRREPLGVNLALGGGGAAAERAAGAPPPPTQPRARSVGNKGIFSPTARTRAAPGSPPAPRGRAHPLPRRDPAWPSTIRSPQPLTWINLTPRPARSLSPSPRSAPPFPTLFLTKSNFGRAHREARVCCLPA